MQSEPEPPKTPRGKRRAAPVGRRGLGARIALGLGKGLGVLVLFVGAAVGSVLLHLDHPLVRKVAVTRVNELLAGLFMGTIEIQQLDHIGLVGVSGVSAVLRDPDGVEVLSAHNVSARLNVGALVRGLTGSIRITLDAVHVERSRVVLAQNDAGELRIANVFLPRDPTPPSDAPSTFHLEIADAVIDEAVVENHLGLDASAELRHLGVGVQVHPERITVALDHAGIRTRGIPGAGGPGADLDGFLAATLALPAADGASLGLHAAIQGSAGGVPLAIVAELSGMNLRADVRAFDPTGERVKTLVPQLPRAVPVDVHVTAFGRIAKEQPSEPAPALHAVVHAQAASARLTSFATLTLNDGTGADGLSEPSVSAVARAEHVDLAELLPEGPASRLGVEIRANATLGTPLRGDFDIDVLDGEIAGQAIPNSKLQGTFVDQNVKLEGTIHEPGAPISLRAALDEGELITFSVQTPPINLASQRRIPRGIASGHASVSASGQLRLSTMALSANAHVQGTELASSGATAKALSLDVTATGPASNPTLKVHAEGSDVIAPNGMAVRKVLADTRVELQPTPTLRDVNVSLDDQHSLVTVQAKTIALQNGIRVDGVKIEGFGQPIEAEIAMHGQRLVIKLHAADIDLTSLGHFLAVHAPPAAVLEAHGKPVADPSQPGVVRTPHPPAKGKGDYPNALPVTGRVTLDVDLVVDGRNIDGHADIDAHDLAGFGVRKGKVVVNGQFRGDTSQLTLRADAAPFGKATLLIDRLKPDGNVLAPESWKRATFRVEADGSGDLATLQDLGLALPVSELRGAVSLDAKATRTDPDKLPELDLHVQTENLEVAAGADLASRDLDLDVRLALHDRAVRLALVAKDPKGTLARVEVDSELPKAIPAALAELADHPVKLQVHVPRRALSNLPAALGLGDLPGRVQLALSAWGTLRDPRFALDFDARGVAPAESLTSSAERRRAARARAKKAGVTAEERAAERAAARKKVPGVDALLRASYDGEAARASVVAGTGGRNILDAQLLLRAKVHELFTQGAGDPTRASIWNREWDVSARVAADELPIEWIPVLGDSGLRGRLGGELVLDGYHKDARMKGAFRIADLRSGRVRYKAARIDVAADNQNATAKLAIDAEEGELQLVAKAGVEWGKRAFPVPTNTDALHIALDAKNFRVAAIQPFVAAYLQQLDGYLDADLDVEVQPRAQTFATKGQVVFSKGLVQTPYVADEFHDVAFRIVVTPDGTAKLENFIARPVEGEIQGSAAVHFAGIEFKNAEARFEIPKRKSIQLAVAGLSLGQVYGSVKMNARTQPTAMKDSAGKPLRGMLVDISVPNLNAELPGIPSADVQKLGRAPDVRVGVMRAGRFVALPLDGSDLVDETDDAVAKVTAPTVLRIDVGNVDFAVGKLAKVSVGGKPVITVGEEATVEGQIQVKSGWVDVQGKRFTVESGVVTFGGKGTDPSNPVVVARAGWTAQDQTRVIAEYIGPVKTGKVELRSEPPLPKSEVLSLVLFGTANGMGTGPSSGQSGTEQAGVAVAGGAATEGLGQAVSGLTGLQAQARIDTSNTNPRPELEIQVAKNVTIGYQQVLGTPPVSQPDTSYGKFAWAFAPNWSLVTTIGNKYSTLLDAIWRYRY